MNIKEFAAKYRVKTRRDSCEEEMIPGRPRKASRSEDRSHIYDQGDGKHFGLCLLFSTARKWTLAKQRLVAIGFTVGQNGETEGTLLFDPSNPDQAKAAIKESGVRTRKMLSEAVRLALADRIKRLRPAEDGAIRAKITTAVPKSGNSTEDLVFGAGAV